MEEKEIGGIIVDERLLGIVDNDGRVIDNGAVYALTHRYGFSETFSIDWKRIAHIHIIQMAKDQSVWKLGLQRGFYISKDGTWLLLIGEYYDDYNDYIKLCGDKLTLLDVYSEKCQNWNVSGLKNLRYLRVELPRTGRSCIIKGLQKLSFLETLILFNIRIDSTLDVSSMNALKQLILIDNNASEKSVIQGIQQLKQVEDLILWYVDCGDHLDFSEHTMLKRLILLGSRSLQTVRGLSSQVKLETLRLCDLTGLEHIDVSKLVSLKSLDLDYCKNLSAISGLRYTTNLVSLDLSYTGIQIIPIDILHMKNIKRLELCGLSLEYLPDWLPELGLSISREHKQEGICLEDTMIAGVDMSIFDESQDIVLQWFEAQKIPLQEVKVVFLGDGEAGKTHTIARLLNDGNTPKPEDFDDKATPGIVIKDKPFDLDGKTVNVHFWDFGGQEILHSMHRMFLTERTLYVVLLNARDDTQDDRARYWLHNIRSFAGNSPVLLVLNKIDQNPNASVNERKLRELYGGLRRVVSLSALVYSPEQFNAALTNALKEEIKALDTVNTLWPASWAKLKTSLETMTDNFITGVEYKQMCRDSGVDKNEKDLLRWFNDLGVSFCYQGSRRLEHYVILRPEWITNGIYILLFNKSEETKNGLIPKRVIYEMLDPEDENAYRRVLGGVAYDVNETEYVLEVMRKFRLSYAVSNDEEFIPALCQRDSMPIAKEYADDPDALEFRMTYDYLPDNVIHRLMVEMRQDLQLSDVWRTGALFRQHGTGLSAVVESEGDVLRIFVRSANPMHRPNTYLCILKENIDRINRDMKLKKPLAEVIYKTSDGNDQFDYEELLNALEDGEETYRSKKLRRRIPIWDILNQTGRGVELELLELRDNILTACMQMQSNRSFWTANDVARIEDERNTYLRDTLINRGYLVNDQHLQGLGSGSRGYGELDLEIRLEKEIPWTILEALRIKDGSKSDWNRHLKKLLDNYNPSGLNHLFLLTYVDVSKDDFEEIMRKFSEHVKWHDELPYVRMPSTFSHVPLRRHGDPAYLQVMRCTYDRNGAPTTVTHIFVRIGE